MKSGDNALKMAALPDPKYWMVVYCFGSGQLGFDNHLINRLPQPIQSQSTLAGLSTF